MCPEIVLKKEYRGPPTDIWAAGILLYALLCGHFPFKGASDKELYKKISSGQFSPPDHVSREARQLLSKMLVVDPDRRHTSQQLLEDAWLRSGGGQAAA
jgi:serine/threonine protein kinase